MCFSLEFVFRSDAGGQTDLDALSSSSSSSSQELMGIDGEPTEFEWNLLPSLTSLQILQKIQSDLRGRNIEPENFGEWIMFMSMFTGIDWTRKGHEEKCFSNSEEVKNYAKRFSTELLFPRRPRTCGTPKKGHLAKFLEHVELGTCAKDAISHSFQSHVECRKTIAVLCQLVGREGVVALRHW